MTKNKKRWLKILLNIIVLIAVVILPYYVFNGRLFIGGDDTRLHYVYPLEFIKNLSLYSWVNISSLPTFLPNHHSIPFLLSLAILQNFLTKTEVFYFAFSLPFLLGFIYFQKFIRELIGNNFEISFTVALIYIFSPITVVSQMSNFLFSMYLMALVPIVGYYYLRFLKEAKKVDILKVVIWSIFFSIAYYAIQWIVGLLLCLLIGSLFLFFIDSSIKKYFKKSAIFGFFIISSQLFWLIPFVTSFLYKGNNDLGGKVVSQSFADSFASTVIETANGSIIYPLSTLYQRQIAVSHEWQLKTIYLNYIDKVMPLSIIFIIIIFLGIIRYKKVLNNDQKKKFFFLLTCFIVVLYFSTVNIGFLKDVFIFLGHIPGFAIFRNFTDKFAFSFIFIYASFMSICLLVIKKSFRIYPIFIFLSLIVIFINFVPTKQIINSPLWKTRNIYTSLIIPDEYNSFLKNVRISLPNDTNVIAFPQNIASYSVITESGGKNAYVGTSPFKFLSGVNDLSGQYSYPPSISEEIKNSILTNNSNKLLKILTQINVGYLMITYNIPPQVLSSYLYEREYLKYQDKKIINSIVEKEKVHSANGNYVIFKLKNSPKVISSNLEVTYKKISPVSYRVRIRGLRNTDELVFLETYHPGWKLYLLKKSDDNANILLRKSIFSNKHRQKGIYGNEWTISQKYIMDNFSNDYFVINKNKSIDVVFNLFFIPQITFYIGIFMSILFLTIGWLYLNKYGTKK